MTLRKPIAIITIVLMTLLPSINIGHALYTVPLPTNTIYADDFENYSLGQQLGPFGCLGKTGAALTGCIGGNGGWGFVDNSTTTGGNANVTSNNFFSCCKSLMTTSTNAANGIFDVDKRFGLLQNSTRIIQLSIWVAFSRTYINEAGNNAHLSLETWDSGNRYEAPLFLLSKTSSDTVCTLGNGVEIDAIGSTTLGPVGTDHYTSVCLSIWNPTSFNSNKGVWHHVTMSVNIVTKQWASVNIDGLDFTSIVCPGGACLFFSNHNGGGDSEFQRYHPFPVRFEIGALNGPSWVSNTDIWEVWHDDLVITDVAAVQPNIITFGIVSASGLFQLILITTAMMYVSSGFGAVMRVFAKDKVPKFLGPKFIIVTGVVGTAGFLFMLIVGANLVQPACPRGFTCVG